MSSRPPVRAYISSAQSSTAAMLRQRTMCFRRILDTCGRELFLDGAAKRFPLRAERPTVVFEERRPVRKGSVLREAEFLEDCAEAQDVDQVLGARVDF